MGRGVRERPRLVVLLAGGAVLLLVVAGLAGAAVRGGDAQARRDADRAELAASRAQARLQRFAHKLRTANVELKRLRVRLADAAAERDRWRARYRTVARRTTTEGGKR